MIYSQLSLNWIYFYFYFGVCMWGGMRLSTFMILKQSPYYGTFLKIRGGGLMLYMKHEGWHPSSGGGPSPTCQVDRATYRPLHAARVLLHQ